jgi:hypothetical protein
MQTAYDQGNWEVIRSESANSGAVAGLLNLLRQAKQRAVSSLSVSIVYSKRLSRNQYVAEVRVAGDPRAVPYYFIYRFSASGPHARILRTESGLSGDSYLTATWEVTRTAHFTVYHSPFQLVGADRSYLTAIEHQRTLFARRFRVKLPPTATYYLYPNVSLMKAMTHGACGGTPGEIGCTSPYVHPPVIQDVIQATFHEPIHVFELALEPKRYEDPLFIAEGTAVALEDRELDPRLSDYCSVLAYAPLDDCARVAVTEVDPLKLLTDQGFRSSDAGAAYSLGGSFVKYLILKYGYYRFGRFYYKLAAQPKDRILDYNVAAHAIFRQSIQKLLGSWKQTLCRAGC